MKKTFETFKPIGTYEEGNIKQVEPSCFNSMVRVNRYRVTIEEIEEPKEVIRQRLVDLLKSDNMHNRDAVRKYAKKHGFELK